MDVDMDMDMDIDQPSYARLFDSAPVYDLVFAPLSPRSLIHVSWTCRAAHSAVASFKARAFNINRHFLQYFTNPHAFRSIQAKTNSLISGSNALQFLDRTFYPGSDLDLYTHPGHSFEVAQFLVEAEGYHYVPRARQVRDWQVATRRDRDKRRTDAEKDEENAYPETRIKGVWTFEKIGIHQECLKIQIIEAWSSPLEVILGFHSTCVMNFISSDAAYSLYPIATFERRSALGMPSSQKSPEAIKKYIRRGWRLYFMPTANSIGFFLNEARWVGDKHSWKLPLDQAGVEERLPLSHASAPLTCDPVLFNGWRVSLSDERQDYDGYECHYYRLHTTSFRYNYAIPDKALCSAIRKCAKQQGKHIRKPVSKVWFDADIAGYLQKIKGDISLSS